jgi:hypothetical protein
MRGNKGQHAIRTLDAFVHLDTCLIADNTLTAEMLRFEPDSPNPYSVIIDGCTVVNNSDQGAPVIYAGVEIALNDSIIDESGIDTINYAGPAGGLSAIYVLATDTSTLPAVPGVLKGQPTYVDADHGDYHLQPTSAGIDVAEAKGGIDLDGNPRDIDLAGVPNKLGPRDLGAYERQNMFQCGTLESIFCNGYEYSW